MALILAINTDGRQTAALERLARELQGHELMGAASCAAWKRPKAAVEDDAGPSLMSSASAAAREWREPATEWLPRVAALAVVLALAGAGFVYWPKLRGALTNGVVVLESGPSGSQVF